MSKTIKTLGNTAQQILNTLAAEGEKGLAQSEFAHAEKAALRRLATKGLVARDAQNVWRITPAGAELADATGTLPVLVATDAGWADAETGAVVEPVETPAEPAALSNLRALRLPSPAEPVADAAPETPAEPTTVKPAPVPRTQPIGTVDDDGVLVIQVLPSTPARGRAPIGWRLELAEKVAQAMRDAQGAAMTSKELAEATGGKPNDCLAALDALHFHLGRPVVNLGKRNRGAWTLLELAEQQPGLRLLRPWG